MGRYTQPGVGNGPAGWLYDSDTAADPVAPTLLRDNMSNTDAGKPWPKVTWDQPTLEMTAEAVMLQNPYVTYLDLETCISSIRNLSETSLYRADPAHGWFFSTGGYQVTFIRSDDGSGWSAWPSISSYTARRYAREAA